MISKRHICISGFLQDKSVKNGLDEIYLSLLKYSSPSTVVSMCSWRDDWDAFAEFIFRTAPDDLDVDVRVYSYSWGCGYGFIRLANELRERGIRIKYAVLCDPVKYYKFLKTRLLLSKWGVLDDPKIRVPDTVDEVWYIRQRLNWPYGHELIADDPDRTVIHDEGFVEKTHQYMDDSPEFRALVKDVSSKK